MPDITDKNIVKAQIIAEIRRVALSFDKQQLSLKAFLQKSKITNFQIRHSFGTWNRAIKSAGLDIYHPRGSSIKEEELLKEIIRLTKELHKPPSGSEMLAFGKFSTTPYSRKWGTFAKGREVAFKKYGPVEIEGKDENGEDKIPEAPKLDIIKNTFKPKASLSKKKGSYGPLIEFRGLRFGPINEQGVVYLFGMISRDLGFLIEAIQTGYPDCEGKRCLDEKGDRWEHVNIEFEYKSSHFQDHGHALEQCDLIVCWINDWEACPIEVLELRSAIKGLSST